MHAPLRRLSSLAALTVLLLAGASPALAEWPSSRGTLTRTGVAPDGSSNITSPEITWRHYLGGSLASWAVAVDDLDGNGSNEVLYMTGGRVVARDGFGNTVWESPPLGLNNMRGVWDMDGDGDLELVVASSNQAMLLDAATGAVVWQEPLGEMGTISGVFVEDVDGDGLPDLLIQECACCGVNSGNTGFVYGFADGTPTQLWTLPVAVCGGTRSTNVFDADGDGDFEVLLGDHYRLLLVDGDDGTTLTEVPITQLRAAWSRCTPTNFDGEAGDELLCILSENETSTDNLRAIFRIDYDATTNTLTQPFETVLGPNDTDVHFPQPLVDLDGDGVDEIVLSTRALGGQWQVRAFDADGNEIITAMPGVHIGNAPLGPNGEWQVVVQTASGAAGYAWDESTGSLLQVWLLAGYTALTTPGPLRWTQADSNRLLYADIDEDGVDELIVFGTDMGGDGVSAFDVRTSPPTLEASFAYPGHFTAVNHLLLPPFNRNHPQVAVVRDDGYLTVFDGALQPIFLGANGGVPGIKVGGYYASGAWRDLRSGAITGDVGDGYDLIFARDSRGQLRAIDASRASSSTTPTVRWRLSDVHGATLVDGLDPAASAGTARALATVRTDAITAVRVDGTELWHHPLGGSTQTIHDVLPAQLDADPEPELVFQWGETTNTLQQVRALDNDGTVLWNAMPWNSGAGRQPAGLTVADFNGDGIDDVYHVGQGFRVFNGTDGTLLTSLAGGGAPGSYGLVTLVDLDADGSAPEAIYHGGFDPVSVAEADLSAMRWASSTDNRPYPYGVVVQCTGGRTVLAHGSWEFPSRLTLVELGAGLLGAETTVVLASGQAYADEAAADAANVFRGQLTSAFAHPNLTGGSRAILLIGSTDGFLYLSDPCTGSTVGTIDFGTAVGASSFADADGDGHDEILVSVADGYLYAVHDFALAAPAQVRDIDPSDLANTTTDLDSLATTDALAVAWDAVANASSYEVALVDEADGSRLVDWTSTTDTVFSVGGLALTVDQRVHALVRAIDANGQHSIDALSDGVRITAMMPGDTVTDTQTDTSPGDTSGGDTSTADAGDTSGGDTSTADTGAGTDTAPADTSTAADMVLDAGTGEGESSGDEGCGCTQLRDTRDGAPRWPVLFGFVLGALALVRRRRA